MAAVVDPLIVSDAIEDLIGDDVTFTTNSYHGVGVLLMRVEDRARWLIRPDGERIELPPLIFAHRRF